MGATIPKLIIAKKYATQELYEKTLAEVLDLPDHDFSSLKMHADILLDIISRLKSLEHLSPILSEAKPAVDNICKYVGKRPAVENYEGMNGSEMYAKLVKLR